MHLLDCGSAFSRLRTVVVGNFSCNRKVTLRKSSIGTERSDCRCSAITEQHLFASVNMELLSSGRLTLEGWWYPSIDHPDIGSVAPGAPHLSMAPPGESLLLGFSFILACSSDMTWKERKEKELSAQSG